MIPVGLLLLLAARVTVVDERATLRPGDWLWEEVRGARAGAVVHCELTQPAGGRVRAALVPKRALEQYRPGDRAKAIADASEADGNRFHQRLGDGQAYAVVVENAGAEAAEVRVRVEIEHDREARELPGPVRNGLLGLSGVMLVGVGVVAWRWWGKLRESGDTLE